MIGPDQETFDRACAGLAAQGFRQALRDGLCRLIDPETGCRCAVGQLIPPEIYVPEMERWSLEKLLNELGCATPQGSSERRSPVAMWFDRLQQAHDNAGMDLAPADMRRRLRDFAVVCGLEAPTSIREDA